MLLGRIPSKRLLRNSRKTERGAKQFLTRLVVRAAPFALPMAVLGVALSGAIALRAQSGSAFERGAALYRSANCRAAIPELSSAVASNPQANLLLGRCYLELQQYKQATDALTNFLKSAPQNPTAVALLAQATEKDGHADASAALLADYLQRNPDEIEIHDALGDLYVRMGKAPDAAAQYHAVTETLPDDPGARIGAGLIALHDEKWRDAIPEFEKARSLVPQDPQVLRGLGTAYLRLDDCGQAVGPLREALKLAPDDFALAKTVATCYTKLSKWTDVLDSLQTGTPQEGADEEVTAMVSKAYLAAGHAAAAEPYYRQVLNDSPNNVTAHLALGQILDEAKHPQEARAQYLEAVKLRPDLPAINEWLGDMASSEKNVAEARKYYEAAARSKAGTDDARMKLARICSASDDVPCMKAALTPIVNPKLSKEVKTLLAQAEFKTKNWEEAGKLAKELLATDKENLPMLKIAGESAFQLKNELEAADLFEEALKLEPANRDLRFQIVAIYSNTKDPARLPRAKEILTEFLTKYQRDAEGYLLLGNVYYMMKDPDNADPSFRQGFDLVTPPIPASLSWAYTAYGEFLFERANYEQARVYQTKAVDLNPKDATSQFNLAVTCLQLNKTDEVNAARQQLVDLQAQELVQKLDEYIAQAAANGGATPR